MTGALFVVLVLVLVAAYIVRKERKLSKVAAAAKAIGGLRIRAWDEVDLLDVVTRYQAEHWAAYGQWAPLGKPHPTRELAEIDIQRFKLMQEVKPNHRTVWP